MKLIPLFYQRHSAPKGVLEIATQYETKFRINFTSFYIFSKELLFQLHSELDLAKSNWDILIASESNYKIQDAFSILTEIANSGLESTELSKQYLDALLDVYRCLPRKPDACAHESVITVAPEREGRILADQMKWLNGVTVTPDFKRMPFQGGLIVGLMGLDIESSYESCNIVDGAIASGATIISIIDLLKGKVKNFKIFSVHSSFQGLYAILNYTNSLNISVSITVGDVTNGLNNKYYAISSKDINQVQVGDLGDIISDFSN